MPIESILIGISAAMGELHLNQPVGVMGWENLFL
jgi:hypothetical protein